MPFRVFAAGEVLTAANVNDYLAEQAVSTFADSGARGSAIASPSEGQFAYLADTNSLTFYNGSAWVNAGSAIAGTALSSGTASSGQVLTANGSGAVTFSTPTQGLTLINTTSFSGVASHSVSDVFSATYDKYKILINITAGTNAQSVLMRMRVSGADNSSNNYENGGYYVGAGQSQAAGSYNNFVSGAFGGIADIDSVAGFDAEVTVSNPFVSKYTSATWQGVGLNFLTGGGIMTVTTSYTGFTILAANSSNITGKVSVYGFNQ